MMLELGCLLMRHVKIEHGGEESTYRLLAIMRPLELGEA